MKRKASVLEEPAAVSDWNTLDYSSSSSASPDSVKAFANHGHISAHWNVDAVPYLNTRTRKRYRDHRPDEKTVHQNTLAKLFNAQKQIRIGEHNEQPPHTSIPASSWMPSTATTHWGSSERHMLNPLLGQPERNQRSIDAFFGGSSRTHVKRNPLPTTFAFSSGQTATEPLPTCDDCNTPLRSGHPHTSTSDNDLMMLDDSLHQDEWVCASCCRRVCDTCAVQGDQRICLECAVPGGGRW